MNPVDFTTAPPAPPLGSAAGGPLGYQGAMSETIADMRWNGDPIAAQLYRDFGCRQPIPDEKGEYHLVKIEGMKPLMNDEGIWRMVTLVHGVVNQVTALSNIDEDRADELTRQVLYQLIIDLPFNQKAWMIEEGDKGTILSTMKSLIFMEFQRPVGGHESTNFRTQTFEQNVQQHLTTPQQQGFSLFNWRKH